MKRFDNFSKEDLWALRNQIVVNSNYYSDYQNTFGIACKSVCDFFDGWLDFITEIMIEDGHKDARDNFFDYFDKYDNPDTLEQWFFCFDDFDWIEYEDEDNEE